MEIVLLILFIISSLTALTIYIISSKKLEYFETVTKNLSAMGVIQNMFEILGANITASQKIKELNNAIIEAYSPKNSTIVIYDGNSYEVMATNVEDTYKALIANIAEEPDFKSNYLKNVSKYITTTSDKTLTYKSAIERNIRSCMFVPIYFNNRYLGFWLLESEQENEFDDISKNEIAKLKNNLGVFIENSASQNIIETAQNTDTQTGLYNNLYLYSTARQKLLEYETSALILIRFNNLNEINEQYSRNVCNMLLIKGINAIKDMVTKDTISVRYSGRKFLLICPNTTAESVHSLAERILTTLSNELVYVNESGISLKQNMLIHTYRKQNNLEKELQKMLTYIDNTKEENSIKII